MQRALLRIGAAVPIALLCILPGAAVATAAEAPASYNHQVPTSYGYGVEAVQTSGPHLTKSSCDITRRHHAMNGYRTSQCYEDKYRWYFDYWR